MLIVTVLGSIITGLATPTEAAALGAFGTTLLAVLSRKLTWTALSKVIYETRTVTATILFVLIGATFFHSFSTRQTETI